MSDSIIPDAGTHRHEKELDYNYCGVCDRTLVTDVGEEKCPHCGYPSLQWVNLNKKRIPFVVAKNIGLKTDHIKLEGQKELSFNTIQ